MKQTGKPSAGRSKLGNRLTAAALALALGGAVYLNYSFSQSVPETVSAAASAQTTALEEESLAVLDPLTGQEVTETGKNYGEAQLVSVSRDSGTEFFEAARLARTKARDEALDALKKSLKNAQLTDEEKTALTEQLNAQVNNITVESALETLIKAKGFADCVVTLDGDKVNVTVMTENDALTADEVTRIRDVVLSQLKGCKAQDITVVEVK